MATATEGTAGKLVGEAGQLLMRGGYNGFSYADLSERLGIRKPSIHHHFPSKVDLVVAVVERTRATTRARTALLDDPSTSAMDQLLAYTGFWQRCITDQTAPFCLAGVLAAELPSLPDGIAASVRGHFVDLARWLERVLALGPASLHREQLVHDLDLGSYVRSTFPTARVESTLTHALGPDITRNEPCHGPSSLMRRHHGRPSVAKRSRLSG